MLTVLLPRAELDDWIARGGTIGSYRKRILDEVRRPIATHGYPWLAMYVTEVRNTPHFHALLWLPLATTIREEVAKWFIRRFGCRLKDRASSYFESLRPWRREVSTPVEFTAVTEARRRAGTELYGFDGAAHYLAKAIEKNSQRQCGRPLGKLIGCSSELIVDHRFKRQSAAT